MLNQSLADTLDLYTQVKQAHWNVKGKDFYQLHLLFDEIAGEIEPFVDLLAERVTLLGGYATGTARMAAQTSALPEYPTEAIEGRQHVEALVERFGIYCQRIRKAIDDSDDIGDPLHGRPLHGDLPSRRQNGSGSSKLIFRRKLEARSSDLNSETRGIGISRLRA